MIRDEIRKAVEIQYEIDWKVPSDIDNFTDKILAIVEYYLDKASHNDYNGSLKG